MFLQGIEFLDQKSNSVSQEAGHSVELYMVCYVQLVAHRYQRALMMAVICHYVAVSRNLILVWYIFPFCALKFSTAPVCYVGL
jgi:hypothetical protein